MNPITYGITTIGQGVILFGQTLRYMYAAPQQLGRIIESAFLIGYRTLPIVAIMSLFIGGVLALQTGFSLQPLAGGQTFLGSIVGLSMCRELAPVMTAFLLAGRVGSAVTAELASMQVYQEIDALRTMNIPPIKILVMPRVLAIVFMMPALTIFSIIAGWFGGMLVSEYVSFINLDSQAYWNGLTRYVDFKSIRDGLVKGEIFGLVVILIACTTGLLTRGGPREIGTSVTRSVVFAMTLILFLDYFITKAQI